jgi:hypothetical protein
MALDAEARAEVGKIPEIELTEARTRLAAVVADQEQKQQALEAVLRLRLVISSRQALAASTVVASDPLQAEGSSSE